MSMTQELLRDILPLVQKSADRHFPEFAFKRVSGGWEATQGEINGSNAKGHLYYYDNTPFCLVNNKTGEKIAIWSYLRTARGLAENQDILRELARMAGYQLPEAERTPAAVSLEQAQRQAGEVMEEFWDWTKELLSQPEGAPTLEALHRRGYSDGDIRAMGLGHNPGWEKSLRYLEGKGHTRVSVEKALKWLKARDTHRIVIPHVDQGGKLVGLWGRVIDGDPPGEITKGKYLPLTDGSPIGKLPFGIENCAGLETVYGVEGIFDARIPAARGIRGVVGWGRKSPTGNQLASLAGIRVKNLVLIPDNDAEGRKGLEQTIRMAIGYGFNVFVVELPSDCKDLDEFVVRHGVDAFREVSRTPISCHRWMGRRILDKHDLDADMGERQALDEIIAYEGMFTDPLDRRQFLEAVGGGLRLSEEALEGLFRDHREYLRQKQSRDRLSRLGRDLIRTDDGRSLSELKDKIEETISTISVGQVSDPVPFDPQEAIEAVQNLPESFPTGYPTLDKYGPIQNPSLVIIAARPGHAKTTLSHNIFRRSMGLEVNAGKPFVFFSLEVPPPRLFFQMLGGETGMSLAEIQREVRTGIMSQRLHLALEKYQGYFRDRRLYIHAGEGLKVEQVCDVAKRICDIHGQMGAVAVDYIGLLANRETGENGEQKHAKVVSHLSSLGRELGCVVLAISQVNREADKPRGASEKRIPRPDQLRYSGQIEQDADAVWALFNVNRDRQIAEQEIGDPDEPRTEEAYVQPAESQVILYSLKDRYGPGFRPINFRMTNGTRIEEWNSGSAVAGNPLNGATQAGIDLEPMDASNQPSEPALGNDEEPF